MAKETGSKKETPLDETITMARIIQDDNQNRRRNIIIALTITLSFGALIIHTLVPVMIALSGKETSVNIILKSWLSFKTTLCWVGFPIGWLFGRRGNKIVQLSNQLKHKH
ncbi:MAG: bacteriorhodopsin [Candidatus Pacebacteria bacterium]|nr:bacteriorhodopsin [Candidatus Paceibacterota bacterium]